MRIDPLVMRIALFTDFFPPQVSGIADSVNDLACSLHDAGHAVAVFTLETPEPATASPFAVYRYPSTQLPVGPGDWRVGWTAGIVRDCGAFQPDILHLHTFGSMGMAAARLARRTSLPLIGTDHTLPEHMLHYFHADRPRTRDWARRATARLYDRCTHVTAPSQYLLRELREYGLRTPASCVSNQVQIDLYRPPTNKTALRRRHGIIRPTAVSAGRLVLEKEVDVALRAFAHARNLGLDADLLVCGDGAARSALEELSSELGIEEHVRFTGMLSSEKLSEMLQAADCCIITSPVETQSLTTMQSMACGLPVVAVAAGALPELVEVGSNGLLGEAGDWKQMGAILRQILLDEHLAVRMGRASRRIAEERFSPDAIRRTFEDIYSACIEPSARGF